MGLVYNEKLWLTGQYLQIACSEDRPRDDDYINMLLGNPNLVAFDDVNLGPLAPLLCLSPPVMGDGRGAHHHCGREFLSISLEASKTFDGLSCSGGIGNQHTVIVLTDKRDIFPLERSKLQLGHRAPVE
jgi:hypothetical protein